MLGSVYADQYYNLHPWKWYIELQKVSSEHVVLMYVFSGNTQVITAGGCLWFWHQHGLHSTCQEYRESPCLTENQNNTNNREIIRKQHFQEYCVFCVHSLKVCILVVVIFSTFIIDRLNSKTIKNMLVSLFWEPFSELITQSVSVFTNICWCLLGSWSQTVFP